MRPERRNAIKVLMLMDIGGTMDEHIKLCEELFSAAKTEFKHLEYFYFHNCLYDYVWKDNRRRHSERTRTFDIMHKYGHDYKLDFVGDATMSPYEILQPGGSIEYSNDEAGAVWLKRMLELRSEEHTSELQSPYDLVCRLLLEKKNKPNVMIRTDYTKENHFDETDY